MKSNIFKSVLSVVFLTASIQSFATPAFTTKYPIGRVLTTRSEELFLSYYCLEHDVAPGAEVTANSKCTATQYAISKSFSAKPDSLGNFTPGWKPIGIVFDESNANTFNEWMKSNYSKAFNKVWNGLFDQPAGWQDEALRIQQSSFDDFIGQVKNYQNVKDSKLVEATNKQNEDLKKSALAAKTLSLGTWAVVRKGINYGYFKIEDFGDYLVKYDFSFAAIGQKGVHHFDSTFREDQHSLIYNNDTAEFSFQDPVGGLMKAQVLNEGGLVTIRIFISNDSEYGWFDCTRM